MPSPTTILRRLRRAALALTLSAGVALPAAAQQQHLLVGDVAAAKLHVYALPEGKLTATVDDLAVAAHAGVVALADGRVLIPDDAQKQLVVLQLTPEGAPAVVKRVPMPIPLSTRYAWAAADPGQSILAVSGLDSDEAVKLLTLVDLKTYEAKQFRVDVGAADAELNLALGGEAEPVLLLHVADRVDSYRVADLMRPAAKINALLDGSLKPAGSATLGRGGHSDSFSSPAGRWAGSTLRGLEVATVTAGGGLAAHKVLPWEADERAGGRNARQRLTVDGRHVFGPLAASVPPAQWSEAEVDLHWADLVDETVRRVPLARGAVGRAGVSPTLAVYASMHPDGDHAHLVDVAPASATFRSVIGRVALPKLANGPVAGQPTAGREGRHAGITPDGSLAFVTQGGEGRISVIDTAAKAVVRTIETPTPLKGGGYVLGVRFGARTADLSAR